jgi:hypothetical protein
MSLFRGIPSVVAGSFFVLLLLAGSLPAQTDPDPDVSPPRPIALFAIASIERSLTDIGRMFEVSGRPDMTEVLNGFLGKRAGDLKGFDRTRPMGCMIFLEYDLPPRPRMVMYLPVSQEEDLLATLRLGPAPITKVAEHDYEIENRRGRGKIPLRFRGSYAYLLPNGDTFLEGYDIPEPEPLVARLTDRYDAAISIDLTGIPPLIKDVFANFFSQQTAAQLQQRDEESDAAYLARRARGMSALQWIEQLLRDGEQVTLGVDSTQDGRNSVLELSIQAEPDSEFAKYLTGIAGAPSYFQPLLSEQRPLQLSTSWNADNREKEAMHGYLSALRTWFASHLRESSQSTSQSLVDTLGATVDQGHIDAIVQLRPQRGTELVLIGGVRVLGDRVLEAPLRDVVEALGELEPLDVKVNVQQSHGVTLHQIIPHEVKSERIRQIYGGKPDLYVGVGNGVLWFGFGCGGTLAALDDVVNTTREAGTASRDGASIPFQMVFRALPLLTQRGTKPKHIRERQMLENAMQPGTDALRVEIQPLESGGRVTIRFDEGFVRLLGQQLAEAYDRTQL